MGTHSIPIVEALGVRPVLSLFVNGEPCLAARFLKTEAQLNIRLQELQRKNPFKNYEIKNAYRVYLGSVPVGDRLDHGRSGKKKISYPSHASLLHKTEEDAYHALKDLRAYFFDLYEGSFWGERTKQAGTMRTHFFLMDHYV